MDELLCRFYFHTAQRIRIEDLVDMQSTIYVKSYYRQDRDNIHPKNEIIFEWTYDRSPDRFDNGRSYLHVQ